MKVRAFLQLDVMPVCRKQLSGLARYGACTAVAFSQNATHQAPMGLQKLATPIWCHKFCEKNDESEPLPRVVPLVSSSRFRGSRFPSDDVWLRLWLFRSRWGRSFLVFVGIHVFLGALFFSSKSVVSVSNSSVIIAHGTMCVHSGAGSFHSTNL